MDIVTYLGNQGFDDLRSWVLGHEMATRFFVAWVLVALGLWIAYAVGRANMGLYHRQVKFRIANALVDELEKSIHEGTTTRREARRLYAAVATALELEHDLLTKRSRQRSVKNRVKDMLHKDLGNRFDQFIDKRKRQRLRRHVEAIKAATPKSIGELLSKFKKPVTKTTTN